MKHKKELHVVYIITTPAGGNTLNISLAVNAQGINTHLVSGINGMMINSTETTTSSQSSGLPSFIQLLKTLRILKQRYPNSIVHTQSGHADIISRWAAWFSGIKTRIHTVHEHRFYKSQNYITRCIYYLLECITSLITTHYICTSSHDVKTGIKFLPGFHERHSIIFNAPAHTHSQDITYYGARAQTSDEFGSTMINEHVQLYRTLSVTPTHTRLLEK